MRACAVEMHMDMSQEAFCAEIYNLDWTPGLNPYRKHPSVWPHCLGKNCENLRFPSFSQRILPLQCLGLALLFCEFACLALKRGYHRVPNTPMAKTMSATPLFFDYIYICIYIIKFD
jgi:hypothetical protein